MIVNNLNYLNHENLISQKIIQAPKLAFLHLESSITQNDREAFEESRKIGQWKGPVEKTALFSYWLSFHDKGLKEKYSKNLANSMPEIPNTIGRKKRDINHIHAITSKQSVGLKKWFNNFEILHNNK